MASVDPPRRRRAVAIDTPPRRERSRAPDPPQQEVDPDPVWEPYDGPTPEYISDPRNPGRQIPAPRTVTQRADALVEMGEREEAERLLMETLQQFIISKTPLDVILQRMGINYTTYQRLRRKLNARTRRQVEQTDAYDYIGPMIEHLEEARATAWRDVALAGTTEWSRRLRALEVAMRANGEIAKVLQLAGVFDNAPMRRAITDTSDEADGASVLRDMAQAFLTGGYAGSRERMSLQRGDRIIDGD